MPKLTPVIETMENRWMRAWVNREVRELKAITASNFLLLSGSKPPVILDRPSWLEAIDKRYSCSSYRFGDIMVRDLGSVALFAAPLEINAAVDGHDFSGAFWVTDLWRKGRVRRGWKLVQRVMSRGDEDKELRAAIKSMQLWK